MQIAEKSRHALLEKGKELRKTVEHAQFLKRLIAVYSSPFIDPKYDYSELIAYEKEQAAKELEARFEEDKNQIVKNLVALFPDNSIKPFCKKSVSGDQKTAIQIICTLSGHPFEDIEGLSQKISGIVTQKTSSNFFGSVDAVVTKSNIVSCVLNQVIDINLVPRQFEFDYIDDIVHIIKSRYAGFEDKHLDRSDLIFQALRIASSAKEDCSNTELPKKIQEVLGAGHNYVPKTGEVHPEVKRGIPDLFDELISIKARNNLERFLEINKEYSCRQRNYHKVHSKGNPWGLPLMAGLEEDHHLMLRTLINLKRQNKLTKEDEVLVVGPRYVDELNFFRKQLGFPKTTGLDLFDDPEEGIVAGDMHATNFSDGQFGLIFCAGTLAYAYDLRKVFREFSRILKKPGFLCLMDAGDRVKGVDPLGRSDPMGLESMLNCFYEHEIVVHAQDHGRTPFPSMFKWWPCVVIELKN